MAQVSSHFGMLLCSWRKSAARTQVEMATQAGVSIATVRNLERGRGTLASLRVVLAAFDLELRGRNVPAGAMHKGLVVLRRRHKMSRRKLAGILGVSRTTLAVLEAGGAGRIETLEAYGAAVGAGLNIVPVSARRHYYV